LPDTDPQRDLIAKALAHEPGAVRELVDRLSPVIERRVTAALWRQARGRDARQEVRDITQEVFLSLFSGDGKALRAWDPTRGMSLDSFVGLLAQHQVASILRSGRASPWRDEPTAEATLDRLPDAHASAESVVRDREKLGLLLARVRERLTPRGIELFQRLVVNEETPEDLCTATGMTRDALYQWRSRLLRSVRAVAAEIEAMSDGTPVPRMSKGGDGE
jgi:RNA polymerase sigma-70 factor (ECF subfamily)